MLTPARIKYGILLLAMAMVFAHQRVRLPEAALLDAPLNFSGAWAWLSEVRSSSEVPTRVPGIDAGSRRRYDRAVRVTLSIQRVQREGRYEALLKTVAGEVRVGRRDHTGKYRSSYRLRYDRRSLELIESPTLVVLLKVNRYDLVAGCELDARLAGRAQLRALPENGYGRYLAGRGVEARLQLSKRYHVLGVDCSRATMGGRLHAGLRDMLRGSAGIDYTDPRYGVVLGLLLGNSGFLQRDMKERARNLGVAHLFAASGLHLGIFYACLYWPLRRLFGKRDPRALFAPLVPCLLYLLALDTPVSLLRAFCFLTSHAVQSLVHRHVPVRELLVNTALIVLALAPGDFFQIGTALSFGAVGGILYFSRILKTTLFAAPIWTAAGPHAAVSLAAGVCTVPLIVLFFEQHPALSLPANLLLVPLIGVLLPLIAGACALTAFGVGALGPLLFVLAGSSGPASSTELLRMYGACLWWPVLAGLDLFLILTEILAYLDGCLIPRDLRDAGGWLVGGVRILPLVADLFVIAGALALRRRQLQAKRLGRPFDPRDMRAARVTIATGIVSLGPPGAWLESCILGLLG
jgi:ComEC/Rec2-related protein